MTPAGKRTLVGLDVSKSMSWNNIAGAPLSAREASAAFAMVIAKTEPEYAIMGFSSTFVPIDVSACSRLSDVIAKISDLPFSGTDCSLPMRWAAEAGAGVDTFLVLTDNETWQGPVHAC